MLLYDVQIILIDQVQTTSPKRLSGKGLLLTMPVAFKHLSMRGDFKCVKKPGLKKSRLNLGRIFEFFTQSSPVS